MTPLLALLRKEAYHIRRDRRTLAVVLALPVVQVLLFGSAIRTDVKQARLAIVDQAPDEATLVLRNRFAASDAFRIVEVTPRTSDLDRLFRTGKAQAGVVLPVGFAGDLDDGAGASVLIVVDATDPNIGSVLHAYAEAVIRGFERERPTGRRPLQIAATTRMRFNPTRESSNLFVPGLMAFVLTILATLMTAISLTREKESGTIEALLVSPLRPWSIIVGKVFPYLVIGAVAALLIIVEARLVFHVPLRGSVVLLAAEAVLFILASLALGILVSTRTSSQRVAMMMAMAGTMLPNVLLSGFIFPIESMPLPLQVLAKAVPGQWFVTLARGIMLKGIGLEYLWKETLILGAMAAVLLAASAAAFRPRLE
jgi:drug efflux transport system permease protein